MKVTFTNINNSAYSKLKQNDIGVKYHSIVHKNNKVIYDVTDAQKFFLAVIKHGIEFQET